MTITNIVLTLVVLLVAGYAMYYIIKKKKTAKVETAVDVDDKTYTIDVMTEFVKKRLDEITKINLYSERINRFELSSSAWKADILTNCTIFA